MTAAPLLPGPPGAFPPGGPGFRDPLTRMLLVNDGYTTPALEAIVDADLSVRVGYQHAMNATELPSTVVDALSVSAHDRVLVRRSRLVHGKLTVSINYVVAASGRAEVYGVDDSSTPIGRSLMSRGVAQRRRILRVGLARWPDGRPCAARAYVLHLDQPLCYIRETFNPSIVSPEHGSHLAEDLDWNDEPDSVHPGAQ
ncbi:hypothetical protein [Nocardia jinanensis]|uniref:DUF98 domain-containing protein n=1 Tax=Nocardia jinanensis TaxID=382504 RepID=A0A917RGL5_9NOCA|nr:hypothetical protein [Nocardia jinanensis]GGL05274.1 hypothetical protein GCM10011588_19770 [Nocardia jinanensis]